MATKTVAQARSKQRRQPAHKARKPTKRARLAPTSYEDDQAAKAGAVLDRIVDGVRAADAAAKAKVAPRSETLVPMTLGQLCSLLGRDIEPEQFAAGALASFADQVETIAAIVDNAPDFSEDSWRLFKNLAERAEYASKVTRWLTSERPAASPEVQL